ncbi:epidermal growth factor receptor kinase substrate 8-like protein 3 [Stegastes partitus]|uniref:Epidermal growth factor receptor kinase substrate 8-like protein 3 n=1 Tax=Stegastes partitus TaxID=144197 RepID=A0A9Y4K9B8_9TELE|nr:PREDICTED: epidermal growth factor receptor kinase substrate 8-like protein 3 [Stegastes partitus]
MFRTNSPFSHETSSYAGSIPSTGYSTMDEISSQVSSLSKPSAKSIYLQRMEYATSINKMMDKFQYRVEHLFTCDLDGREMRNIRDCVERLKLLDEMGRVWGQNMLLELRDANLLLTDIESKEELDSLAVSDIQELEAVLDAGGFNSLLTVSVQQRRKHTTKVYLFQCDDIRADYVQKSLSQALLRKRGNADIRNTAKPPSKPPAEPVPQWIGPDYDEDSPESDLEDDRTLTEVPTPPPSYRIEPLPPRRYTELDRNVDILNHILGDIEIFMGQVAAAEAKNAKKKKKKKKGKVIEGMPPREEFATCLHQVKCGLNLLGELKGQISSPSAGDFVHSFFSTIGFVVSHCPEDLPPSIVAPLLTPYCIRLMSEEASTEEDTLWQSLGDAWNIPSTQWPEDDEDIPTYTLEFSDGWQPPEVSAEPEPSEPVRRPANSPPAPRQPERRQENPPPSPRQPERRQENPPPAPRQVNFKPPGSFPGEGKQMRVKHDFTSRNSRELSVSKGEVVELLDMSKQWWKVRNRRGEEGFIPNNLLESDEDKPDEEEVSPVLTKKAKPAEVKAWLEDKGFSKITVRCLGVLSGSMLLGMTREELKSVCPEEGGRVFYQLQLVKSTLAVAALERSP